MHTQKLAFSFLMATSMSSGAIASTIDVVNRSSSVKVFESSYETGYEDVQEIQSSATGSFNETVLLSRFETKASQNSWITANSIHYQDSTRLRAGTPSDWQYSEASSVFSVTFDVAQTTQFELDWSFLGAGGVDANGPHPSVKIADQSGQTKFYFAWDFQRASYGPTGPLGSWAKCDWFGAECPWQPYGDLDGTIQSGRYTMTISNDMDSRADRWGDFATVTSDINLVLTPVPVPGAIWLMGSALLGLAGAARMRKTA